MWICTSFHTTHSTRRDSYDAYIASLYMIPVKKEIFHIPLQFHTCTNNHNSRSHVVSIHASVRREACRTYPISHRSILLARYCTLQCEYTRYANCLSRYRCETLVPIVSPHRDNTCLYCYVSSSLVVTFCHLAV